MAKALAKGRGPATAVWGGNRVRGHAEVEVGGERLSRAHALIENSDGWCSGEGGAHAFDRLSGGQQARFQILLLELSGTTALLLDEPTDNLDLESAEALQEGLEAYEGTVLAVTHDRWFARSFDRYLVFGSDGVVRETPGTVWDERRVERAR